MLEKYEPSADENDRASHAEHTHNQDSVERIRALAKPESHPDFDGLHCVACGDIIPKQRLALIKVRCVSCQSKLERYATRRGS